MLRGREIAAWMPTCPSALWPPQRYEAHIERLRREVHRLRAELHGGRTPSAGGWSAAPLGGVAQIGAKSIFTPGRVGMLGEGAAAVRVAELEGENEHLRRQLKQVRMERNVARRRP